MVVTFALFSMPFLSNNKQPNVDYHVWMDQQVNAVANDPALQPPRRAQLVDLPAGG